MAPYPPATGVIGVTAPSTLITPNLATPTKPAKSSDCLPFISILSECEQASLPAAGSNEPILNSINFSLCFFPFPFFFLSSNQSSPGASLIVPIYHKPGTMYIHHTYQLNSCTPIHHVRARMYLLEWDLTWSCFLSKACIECSTTYNIPPHLLFSLPIQPSISYHMPSARTDQSSFYYLPTSSLSPSPPRISEDISEKE